MGCCISTAIGLSWTEDQLEEKAVGIDSRHQKSNGQCFPSSTLQSASEPSLNRNGYMRWLSPIPIPFYKRIRIGNNRYLKE